MSHTAYGTRGSQAPHGVTGAIATETVRTSTGARERLSPEAREALCAQLDQMPLVEEWRAILAGQAAFPQADRWRLATLVETYGAEGIDDAPHAPHVFAPTLLDPKVRERLGAAIRVGALRAEGVAEVMLAFPRSYSAWALAETREARRDAERAGPAFHTLQAPAPAAPPIDRAALLASIEPSDGPLAGVPLLEDARELPDHSMQGWATRLSAWDRWQDHQTMLRRQAGQRVTLAPFVDGHAMSARTFGVEFEGFLAGGGTLEAQQARVRDAFAAAGLAGWDVGSDHTVWNDQTETMGGLEVRSPILQGEPGLAQLGAAFEVLQTLTFVTNDTCAFHVHHGATVDGQPATFAAVQQAAAAIFAQEDHLDAYVAPERRGSAHRFSRRLGALVTDDGVVEAEPEALGAEIAEATTEAELAAALNPLTKAHKFSFRSLAVRGTIENRMRDGGFRSAQDVIDYVRFSDTLVDHAFQGLTVLPIGEYEFESRLAPTLAAQQLASVAASDAQAPATPRRRVTSGEDAAAAPAAVIPSATARGALV